MRVRIRNDIKGLQFLIVYTCIAEIKSMISRHIYTT